MIPLLFVQMLFHARQDKREHAVSECPPDTHTHDPQIDARQYQVLFRARTNNTHVCHVRFVEYPHNNSLK